MTVPCSYDVLFLTYLSSEPFVLTGAAAIVRYGIILDVLRVFDLNGFFETKRPLSAEAPYCCFDACRYNVLFMTEIRGIYRRAQSSTIESDTTRARYTLIRNRIRPR